MGRGFHQPLDLRTLSSVMGADAVRDDERNYILLEDLTYPFTDTAGNIQFITVPRGFVTDLASIPRIAWPLIGPSGMHAQAAVLHDWLYRSWTHNFTRREADAIFRDAMEDSGVNAVRKLILWFGVRLPVGAWIWHRNKKSSPRFIHLP